MGCRGSKALQGTGQRRGGGAGWKLELLLLLRRRGMGWGSPWWLATVAVATVGMKSPWGCMVGGRLTHHSPSG